MMNSHFDDILNDCIERLAAGETLAQCLARYPEHADDLAPLLQMSRETRRISQVASPTPAARAHGKARMQAALAQAKRRSAKRRRFWQIPIPTLAWRPISTPMAAAFVIVFLTIVAAGGTTVASNDSIPGEPLYPVKSICESVEEFVARTAERKAQVHAKHARERGREMRELIIRGRIHDAETTAFRLQNHLNQSATLIGVVVPSHYIEMPRMPAHHSKRKDADQLRRQLSHDEAYVKNQLTAVVEKVPEHHKRRVWRLMHQSDLGYKIIIIALDANNQNAPGAYYGYYAMPIHEPPHAKHRKDNPDNHNDIN